MKTIIVLGMHRSATSLVAKGLASEIHMGTHLLEPQPDNPHGFYENMHFVALNDILLKNAGGSWHNPPAHEDILMANTHMDYTIKAVVDQEKREPIWGWKDPRTTLTIDLYLPHIENPHIVAVYRDPAEAAASLARREGWAPAVAHALVNKYNIRLSEFVERWISR